MFFKIYRDIRIPKMRIFFLHSEQNICDSFIILKLVFLIINFNKFHGKYLIIRQKILCAVGSFMKKTKINKDCGHRGRSYQLRASFRSHIRDFQQHSTSEAIDFQAMKCEKKFSTKKLKSVTK